MEIINQKLTSISDHEKNDWIYNLARVTEDNKRIAFLDSIIERLEVHPSTVDMDWIEVWRKNIESGKVYFECSGYEVYGESYWDSDFEYDYFDEFEITNDLLKAFQFAGELLYRKITRKHPNWKRHNNRNPYSF